MIEPTRMTMSKRDLDDVLSALKMNMGKIHVELERGSDENGWNSAKLDRLVNLYRRILVFERTHAYRTRAYREQQESAQELPERTNIEEITFTSWE